MISKMVVASLILAGIAGPAVAVAVAAKFPVTGEWVLQDQDCDEAPAKWYAVIGPNYLITPTSTCVYDPKAFSVLFSEGYVAIPGNCYYSADSTAEQWEAGDREAGVWDIEVLDDGNGIRVGDSPPYKRCPKPLNLPGRPSAPL
jgi:hypothetical protein